MTSNLLETLYSKKLKDFSKEDIDYVKKLLLNNKNESLKRFIYFGLPIATTVVGGVVGLFAGSPVVGIVLGFCSGGVISLRCANEASFSRYSLEELGLTKQEWKELKKSGRLKKLERMVKESENIQDTKFGKNDEVEFVQNQFKTNETSRQQNQYLVNKVNRENKENPVEVTINK